MTKREKYMSITKISNISVNNCSQVKKQSFSKTTENIQNGYLTGTNTQASLKKVPYISYLKQIILNNNISFKSSQISNYIKLYLIKNIIKKLKKRKLPKMQKVSLVIIGINPCLVFSIAIKFRRLLESFL